METDSTPSPDPVDRDTADRTRVAAAIGAVQLAVMLAAVVLIQIEVTDAQVAATRGCGSVFDCVVERSGWQQWWAADLVETDEVRSALVRTNHCPGAVNQRVTVAAVLGMTAAVLGVVTMARRKPDRSADTPASTVGRRVTRIGRLTSALGGTLTALGIIAIVVLVADADSTLFLYTDRLVVAIVGLIVLIPTVTLFVIGRVLVLLGDNIQRFERERSDG